MATARPAHKKKSLRKLRREAEELIHQTRKFRIYQSDLLSDEELREVKEVEADLHEALRARDEQMLEGALKIGRKLRKKHFPVGKGDWVVENIEVALVAIIIALAIRTYFLQPFKIPTGSMEPTLNGVRLVQFEDTFPSLPFRVWDMVISGRSYVDVKAKATGRIDGLSGGPYMFWFEYTDLYIGGVPHRIWANPQAVHKYLDQEGMVNTIQTPSGGTKLVGTKTFAPGETVIRAAVDTGDQVLVNKMAYHFFRPEVGDVIVFTTGNIPLLQASREAQGFEGSQYYIKRCTGTPGDVLALDPPKLLINGQPVEEPPIFRKIYSMQDGYNGYVVPREGEAHWREAMQYLAPAGKTFTVPPDKYWAMGDNSMSSLDSRYWGGVPARDLSGTALMVYWPFTAHWGWIY